ncbi:accessory Sec system glycosylation chaperone GtfB [Liquorilactobacillus hordei]|uniref:accessory Sec system glycosylation chaperone GtfB n=1 Tax=Liquorilactobacillus hordei TaxID=468911 RepID=UPI001CBBFBA3|nr:accessory Sec system glycosylation chaperone GtfB [Liquorilactobacillus hordei]MBZ2405244.1 accessory Sec system glycosylation chaperone GtfB [Liquorilactobacillus hordei]
MINIFDRNDQATIDVIDSFKAIGDDAQTIMLHDDGWLPDSVISPWSYFTYRDYTGKPLFFNEVQVPDYWEIRGDGSGAKIYDYQRVAGKIVYTNPTTLRHVKEVHWFDMSGNLKTIDHYNRFGWRFAQSVYLKNKQLVMKTYYTEDGHEKIVENLATGSLTLNEDEQVIIFNSKTEFFKYFINKASFETDSIRYNSLADPFFISLGYNHSGKDILFWQEPIGKQIPGNMNFIIEGKAPRTKKIVFFDGNDLAKVKESVGSKNTVDLVKGGYVYQHDRANSGSNEALIMTNSDQIEQIEVLVQKLPKLIFHIAAVTEMSDKLLKLKVYPNVKLYPNIATKKLTRLWKICDIYLDINHQGELLNAVRKAFENNLLIYAFSNTAHNQNYVINEQVYKPDELVGMITDLKNCINNKEYLKQQIKKQQIAAGEITVADFSRLTEV